MPEEIVPRLLRETIDGGIFSLVEGDEYASIGWSGYIQAEDASSYYKLFFGYFDLSGYTVEQKTLFIQNVLFQNVGNNYLGNMQAGFGVDECRIVSTVPLDQTDFTTATLDGGWNIPGHPESDFSMQQIIRGSMLQYHLDQGAVVGGVSQQSSWGLGDATAADKLYYARVFRYSRTIVGGLANYKATFSPMVVAVAGMVVEEPDLEYIMRLKRSIDLAE